MDSISPHITYLEATRTSTGLPNVPNQAEICAMIQIAECVFEPLRSYIKQPIFVTSFFRSKYVNKAVGGSATSQHTKGEAMDIKCTGRNAEMFKYIRERLMFDQLIWEFGNDNEPAWVHVSCKRNGNRMQVLKAVKVNGKTKYIRL